MLGGIVVAALVGLGAYFLFGSHDDPATTAATYSSPGAVATDPNSVQTQADVPEPTDTTLPATTQPVTPSTSFAPSPTPRSLTPKEKRAAALTTLEQMVVADRATNPIRGQWVAQLASKYEGVVDKTQQSGPFTIPQILAETQALKSNAEYGSLVRVVHQGDWGRSQALAKTLWVTIVDLDASSRTDIVSWCEDHFTQRGQALLNVCYPRELYRK